MAFQVTFRQGTAASWSSTNPTLAQGEIGVTTDTNIFKIGNGSTAWNSLAIAPTASPTQTTPWRSLGDGGDGNVTISSGVTTLTRDMFYNNLTINGTGSIFTNGYKIFIKGILDLTAAPVGAINFNGSNGGNASGATGGSAAAAVANNSVGGSLAGGAGATATTAAGTQGTTGANGGNGGGTNNSGAGGTGTNAGGAAAAGATATVQLFTRKFEPNLIRGVSLILGGSSGRGGSAGGGDGTNSGAGGGAGGNGGGVVAIYANTIIKSANTPTGAIQCLGGNGGNGANATAGVTGGGGGGAAGGGGWIYLTYNYLMGPTVNGLLQADGGTGGWGGNGFGTTDPVLSAGGGGAGGYGGRITLFQIPTRAGFEIFGDAITNKNPEVTTGIVAIPQFPKTGTQGGDPGLTRVSL